MTPSTSNQAEIEQIFSDIRDQLDQQNAEALKASEKKLTATGASPDVLMKILSSYLFCPASDEGTFSSDEALSILGFLVSLDSARYLRPASLAVKNEAVALTTSDRSATVSNDLMKTLVDQLSNADIQVSTNATDSIVACCRKLGPSFGEPVLKMIAEAWRAAWSKGRVASTVAVRCASAIVDIVCLDDSMMCAAKSCGDISLILTMLTDESDPLMETSTLDLIERLATTLPMHHERARWLISNDIVVPLLQMAGGTEQGYPDPILGGPALRVVAALCKLGHRDSELFNLADTELLSGFHMALHNFEVSGELDRLALIDAISSFASASSDALDLILNDPVTRKAWMSLSVAQPKLKAAILGSVSIVLNPPDEDGTNADSVPSPAPSNKMGLKCFSMLGQTNDADPSELVLSLAKAPVVETRLAAYALMKAVAKLQTGAQVLMTCPGFYDFLIDRDVEKTKEGKEAKYEVVEAIMSSEAKGLLAEDIVRSLSKYIKEGPHYVKTKQWDIATEE